MLQVKLLVISHPGQDVLVFWVRDYGGAYEVWACVRV